MHKVAGGRVQAPMLLVMGSKSSEQAIRRLRVNAFSFRLQDKPQPKLQLKKKLKPQLFVTSALSYKKINGV